MADDPPPAIVLRDVADVADGAGVAFRYSNGSRGRHDLPEIMGGGVAMIDADGDGRLDLFFCDGGPIGDSKADDSPCRLYRNNGDGTFTDRTAKAGAPGPSFATGVAVGDYDRDGRDDLFVTGWRDQRLYHNRGGGLFADVTARAGVGSDRWGTSAAWADLDGDGDLDLYVAAYLEYDPGHSPYCAAPDGRRDYCGPEDFPPQRDTLYRNNGDGTFSDVTDAARMDDPPGRGLGVLVADLVGDARPDLFVANDGTACRLHENLGGLRFREVGEASGVAFDGNGQAIAGMGVALGDVEGKGRSDLLVTNFLGRSTVAFRPDDARTYRDLSPFTGLTAATRDVVGFGLALVDLDGDGALDLIQANGHVLDRARLGVPFAMPMTLRRNQAGRLTKVFPDDPALARPRLGRGLAVGDLDGDGRPDVVVTAIDTPPLVLMNRSKARSIAVELVGKDGRQPFGARLRASVGGRSLVRDLPGGGSYLSASDRTLFLGIGDATRLDRLDVAWPSGRSESWRDLPTSKRLRVVEGSGSLYPKANP